MLISSLADSNAVTKAGQVTISGPKLIPGTLRRISIAMATVVDLETIPGGATKTI
jgi:hypothetical protein